MRKFLFGATAVLLVLTMTLAVMELVLRLTPSLMSVSVIGRMHPDLRSEIAGLLGLPVQEDFAVIKSEDRLDKGPDLHLMKPNRDFYRPVDPIDLAFGAVDTVRADARGSCNPADTDGIAEFDVITLGGSVPNCSSVGGKNVFSTVLGRVLGASSYNMTIPGVGPYEYNEVLAQFGQELNPRLAIFAVSEANDLRDSQRYLDYRGSGGGGPKQKAGGPFRVSYVLGFTKASIELLAKQVSASTKPDFRYSVRAGGADVKMNVSNGDIDELKSAQRMAAGELTADLYADPLKRFVELSRSSGAIPIVMYVPAAYTVYQDNAKFEDTSLAPLMANYSNVQRNWLADNASTIGYQFVDPTAALQLAAVSAPLLYFPSDLHLTAAGHEALARAVADDVRSALAGANP